MKTDADIRAEINHCKERLIRLEVEQDHLTPLGIEERTALTARKNALIWVLE